MKTTEITVLYVEDDREVLDRICTELRSSYPGMTILTANNGAEGMETYEEHHPDIIITDINMPVMDGVQMAKKIKTLDEGAAVIAVTAYSDTEYLLRAIDAGINHYILKPVSYDSLFAAIDKSIEVIYLKKRVQQQNEHIRKLSKAVESSPVSVIITDSLGTIEYVNRKFTEITGYNQEESLGHNPRLLKGETPPHIYSELWGTLAAGQEWHGEFLNKRKDGSYYWEEAFISPILDEAGKISHFVAVKEDITERKEAEQEIARLNIDLAAHAEGLKAANRELEAFNYTVAHDLRNPLNHISLSCQALKELYSDQVHDEPMRYIEEICNSASRMEELIDALLRFSSIDHVELHPGRTYLSMLAQEAAKELKQTEPERKVDFIIADGLVAHGDASLLRVVLNNLLGNAWKYSSMREKAVIEFGVTKIKGVPAYFVRDNGAGFDMADADKLFTPFHRLSDAKKHKGFGVGLATVERIIKRHGGKAWAEGEPGKGACFYFTLTAD